METVTSDGTTGTSEPADSIFRCPACGNAVLPDTPPELVCPACGKRYPVVDGIYDLRPSPPEHE